MLRLETERLLLKPHTLADVEYMHLWENDAELLYYNDNRPEDRKSDTPEEIQKYLTEIIQEKPLPKIIYYAVHKKSTQQLIGYGMIAFIDRYNQQCKLGIVVGEKHEWGQGYAKEVLRAVIAYCFTTLDMNRIGVEIYDINQRAIRLFEHLGFKREGVVREAVLKKGKFVDEYIYGLLRSEWNEQGLHA
jgi:RimJ/RimL family protein N-acetyltransferase